MYDGHLVNTTFLNVSLHFNRTRMLLIVRVSVTLTQNASAFACTFGTDCIVQCIVNKDF